MGLILDSIVLIAAERKGQNAHQALAEIAVHAAGEDVAMSVVTVIELAHGVARANTPQRKATRRLFLNELMTALPAHPVTVPVALRAGQIDGENTALGVPVALSDLLIGVTALELGYRVATANVRHFQMVPGLRIRLPLRGKSLFLAGLFERWGCKPLTGGDYHTRDFPEHCCAIWPWPERMEACAIL